MLDTIALLITPEILQIISEIDEFKGAWLSLCKLPPERMSVLKEVALLERIGSSIRIEGSKLTNQQVGALISRPKAYAFLAHDEQEVAGYAFVCKEIFEGFENITFSEGTIKQLHASLSKFSDKNIHYRGDYKKLPNYMEAFDLAGNSRGALFDTPPPFKIPLKMQNLANWTLEAFQTKELHPLIIIGIFIANFLIIHPFQERNGQLSRILANLLFLKAGYNYVPYGSFESVIEANRENYYSILKETQSTLETSQPNWGPWILFFLKSLQQQKRLLEQKIKRERALSLQLSTLSENIIKLTEEHGRLSVREFQIMTKANRNTIKKHLQKFVASNQLQRHGKGRATWYTLP